MYGIRIPQYFGTVRPHQPSLPKGRPLTTGRVRREEVKRMTQDRDINGLTVPPRTEPADEESESVR